MCIVTTIPMAMNVFMGPHVRGLASRFQITLVANGNESELRGLMTANVRFHAIPIQRGIALWRDLKSLLALWRLFRQDRFVVVYSMMPKSGLLAMTAAALARVPCRVHWFTGQVWATQSGLFRQLLKAMDRVLAACATHLLTDSASQREYLIGEGIVKPERIQVLAHGSVCGVDVARFRPDPTTRRVIRSSLGIPESAVLALFLGRLNRDKGIPDLADAFALAVRRCGHPLHLLLVGPDEGGMRELVADKLGESSRLVHHVDFTDEPEKFMSSSDFFVMPSHREGFGSTVIEAAACGLPAIATRIYGLTDAVVEEVTGILVPDHDPSALADAIVRLTRDQPLRMELGNNALQRVRSDFPQERLVSAVVAFYERICPSSPAT